jgi:hypothetical protein
MTLNRDNQMLAEKQKKITALIAALESAKPKEVFVVVGNNDEFYGAYDEWPVCAYADKALANQHAKLAQEKARREDGLGNPYDPNPHKHHDYPGWNYGVFTVPLLSALPDVPRETEEPNDGS